MVNGKTFLWLKENNIVFDDKCKHKWLDYMFHIGETESDGSCFLCDNCGILIEKMKKNKTETNLI